MVQTRCPDPAPAPALVLALALALATEVGCANYPDKPRCSAAYVGNLVWTCYRLCFDAAAAVAAAVAFGAAAVAVGAAAAAGCSDAAAAVMTFAENSSLYYQHNYSFVDPADCLVLTFVH